MPETMGTLAKSNGVASPLPDGAGRVLVVDDHAMNVELLAIHLRRLGYQVASADSGPAALAAVAAEPPDLILLDVLMPGMSGLEVLRRLRDDPASADLPVILVSGLGETEDIVEGLQLGANDYVTKPINLPVLQARLATHAALKRARDALKQSAALLGAALERNARELRVAGQVQRSILPRTPPACDALGVAWCYEPATDVGGDLFDVAPLSGGRMLLFLADAMGHGVQAALVAATVKATLAVHLDEADDLPRLLTHLDRALARLFDDRFVTAAACVLDPAARRLRYALAGHPPLLVATRDGVVAHAAGGLPLGTALGWGFEAGEASLEPGDAILLYSDGLSEALGPDGSQLGQRAVAERFAAAAALPPDQIVGALRSGLGQFRGGAPPDDDLTILAARVH
jgi:phosphoserine phosphatase RsbU/P